MGKAYAHKFEGNETQLNKLTLAHLDENSWPLECCLMNKHFLYFLGDTNCYFYEDLAA
jgi:hypothetical protein